MMLSDIGKGIQTKLLGVVTSAFLHLVLRWDKAG